MADHTVDVTLDEDSVSFLASIRGDCHDIFSILTTRQVKLLSQNPSAPYSKGNAEKEHLSDAWEYLKVRSKWNECRNHLTRFVLAPTEERELSTTYTVEIFDRKKIALEKVSLCHYLVIFCNARSLMFASALNVRR